MGRSIANALITHQLAKLEAILTTSMEHSQGIGEELKAGQAIGDLGAIPYADISFITTPDDVIGSVVASLEKLSNLKPGSIVVHCSGVLCSEILAPLRQQGCYVASFHPLKAFRAQRLDPDVFQDCDCVMEGDQEALDCLSALFGALRTNLISINSESKIKYHAAAVMASNYLVTLSSLATELMEEAGIANAIAKTMITNLMQSSLDNIKEARIPKEALTGPLLRGDLTTIKMHLAHLPQVHMMDFYRQAGLATLTITTHDEDKRRSLEALLLDS